MPCESMCSAEEECEEQAESEPICTCNGMNVLTLLILYVTITG